VRCEFRLIRHADAAQLRTPFKVSSLKELTQEPSYRYSCHPVGAMPCRVDPRWFGNEGFPIGKKHQAGEKHQGACGCAVAGAATWAIGGCVPPLGCAP